MDRIVVGVDGSENANLALAWAGEEARIHAAELHIVTSYGPSGSLFVAGDPLAVTDDIRDRLERHAEDVQDRALAQFAEKPPKLRREIAMGPPASALLHAAGGADLLVVGARGLGGFKGLLLGSVSHKCVTHAPCPVAVIPAPDHDGDPTEAPSPVESP